MVFNHKYYNQSLVDSLSVKKEKKMKKLKPEGETWEQKFELFQLCLKYSNKFKCKLDLNYKFFELIQKYSEFGINSSEFGINMALHARLTAYNWWYTDMKNGYSLSYS